MKLLVILALSAALCYIFRQKLQSLYDSMFPNLDPTVKEIVWFCMFLFPLALITYLAIVYGWI